VLALGECVYKIENSVLALGECVYSAEFVWFIMLFWKSVQNRQLFKRKKKQQFFEFQKQHNNSENNSLFAEVKYILRNLNSFGETSVVVLVLWSLI
jgi:hypothetical protein